MIRTAEPSTYIKLDRNMQTWRWYKDANTFRVFVHLLFRANIKDADFERITVHRGELVTSYPHLAKDLDISIQSARTAITHLKSTGEITVKSYSKFSVITVLNYDKYQSVQQAKQQATNRQVTGNQQATNNNQRNKEIKNERNIDSNESIKDVFEKFAENDPELLEALRSFEQMRKQIKKPMTDKAKVLLLKKLETFPHAHWVEILNNSVINSWQGIFPLDKRKEERDEPGHYTLSNGMKTSNQFLAMLDKERNEQNRNDSDTGYIESSFS